jgi:hypothetical protein
LALSNRLPGKIANAVSIPIVPAKGRATPAAPQQWTLILILRLQHLRLRLSHTECGQNQQHCQC